MEEHLIPSLACEITIVVGCRDVTAAEVDGVMLVCCAGVIVVICVVVVVAVAAAVVACDGECDDDVAAADFRCWRCIS